MRMAVGSDMDAPVVHAVVEWLQQKGHLVTLFGAPVQSEGALWPEVGAMVARQVSEGQFDQAVLFCWTGTGISIAANKVPGIRAALCGDAETARGARVWNDANVLCMSIRMVSSYVAVEILEAWLGAQPSADPVDVACVQHLRLMEKNMPTQA